jgi:hypothetical protein
MKRYVVELETGYVGMTTHEALSMPEDHTDDELAQTVWDMAVDHASSYGIEVGDSDSFDPDGEEEYSGEDVEGYAELYDPEKHDMLRPGGGSFLDDFEYMEK